MKYFDPYYCSIIIVQWTFARLFRMEFQWKSIQNREHSPTQFSQFQNVKLVVNIVLLYPSHCSQNYSYFFFHVALSTSNIHEMEERHMWICLLNASLLTACVLILLLLLCLLLSHICSYVFVAVSSLDTSRTPLSSLQFACGCCNYSSALA